MARFANTRERWPGTWSNQKVRAPLELEECKVACATEAELHRSGQVDITSRTGPNGCYTSTARACRRIACRGAKSSNLPLMFSLCSDKIAVVCDPIGSHQVRQRRHEPRTFTKLLDCAGGEAAQWQTSILVLRASSQCDGKVRCPT